MLTAVVELLMFSTRPILKLHINRTLYLLRQLRLVILEVLGKIIRRTRIDVCVILDFLVCCCTCFLPIFPMLLIYLTDILLLISGRIFGVEKAIRCVLMICL